MGGQTAMNDPSRNPARASTECRAAAPGSKETAVSGGEGSVTPASQSGSMAPLPDAFPCPFGAYVLLGEVARGGMGVVYRARHQVLDRIVALKMILAATEAGDTSLERFIREARAAAALDHPGIVPVHDSGVQGGRHYLVMTFVEGRSLVDLVRGDGPPGPGESARLVRAAAEAVAHAHAHGVIHRDLKPHNVLVDRKGRPRVTDFGLARRLQEGASLTASGQLMGTPAYMAPEQALGRGSEVGPAADVYGLGGILYFLLTGRPPFVAETVVGVLFKAAHEAPTPPRQLNPQVPEGLEAVCLRCLEKGPADRYPSSAALAEALAPFAGCELQQSGSGEHQARSASGSVKARSASEGARLALAGASGFEGRKRRFRRAVLAGAAVLLAALGAVAVLWSGRQTPEAPPEPGPAPAAPVVERQAEPPASFPKPSFHDFGLTIELADSRPGQNGQRLLSVGQRAQLRLQSERDAYVYVWTTDADGAIVQLFPNEYEKDGLVKAGQPRLVPGTPDYVIELSPSRATEFVRVLARTQPVAQPAGGESAGPFVAFRSPAARREVAGVYARVVAERGMALRPAEVVANQGPQASVPAVTEVLVPYFVEPR
jgi:predicted Ser/Thr protein kinase